MAQTTGAIARSGYLVEISANGSTWTDVSGTNTTVETSGGEIGVAESFTAEGDEAIVKTTGKNAPREVTFKSLYTEGSGEEFNTIWGYYIGATKLVYVRWSPAGGAVGTKRYVTAVAGAAAAVPITKCTPPDLDANSEDLAMFEWGVKTPGLLQETIS